MKGFRQKPRVLVVGGGTLAQALEKSFSLGGIVTFRAGRNPGAWHLDLSRDPGCWNVPGDLDWVFVCAGMTSRAECEKQPHLSRWINMGGSVRLARYFLSRGAKVVFFGTDLSPEAGEYAKQKEELRRQLAQLPGSVWIRLGKVVHHTPVRFYKAGKNLWLRERRSKPSLPSGFFPFRRRPLRKAAGIWSPRGRGRERRWSGRHPRSMTYVELARKWGQFLGYPASRDPHSGEKKSAGGVGPISRLPLERIRSHLGGCG